MLCLETLKIAIIKLLKKEIFRIVIITMERQINKIYHEDNGRYKLIQKSKVTSNGVYHRHEKKEWLNCVQCGKRVVNNKFHFCVKCHRNWLCSTKKR